MENYTAQVELDTVGIKAMQLCPGFQTFSNEYVFYALMYQKQIIRFVLIWDSNKGRRKIFSDFVCDY